MLRWVYPLRSRPLATGEGYLRLPQLCVAQSLTHFVPEGGYWAVRRRGRPGVPIHRVFRSVS
jgi:hypothetical protein